MEILNKLKPWNWFKHEEPDPAVSMPVSNNGHRMSSFNLTLEHLHRQIDRMFNDISRHIGLPDMAYPLIAPDSNVFDIAKPHLDIAAEKDHYSIEVEIPGLDEENIEIEVEGDSLVIRGEKKQESKSRKKDYYRIERTYGAFRRVLSLPGDSVVEQIVATTRNGVLTITIPRSQQVDTSNHRRIEISNTA